MPRTMPPLAASLQQQLAQALQLAEVGEVARVEALAGSQTKRDLHVSRLEYIYELAYLRMFYAWEAFLEQAFTRYMCGYLSPVGATTFKPGVTPAATLAAANITMLGGNSYVLWHNPNGVITRSQKYFASCPIEAVFQSNLPRLEHLAATRHRIVHAQDDARNRFDLASMAIAGRRYHGSRVGAFLRDTVPNSQPPTRWVEQLATELGGMAGQIA